MRRKFIALVALSILSSGLGSPNARAIGSELARPMGAVDDPDTLDSTHPLERNLAILERDAPHAMKLDIHPWANAGWKLASGLLSERYAEPGFKSQSDWVAKRNYVTRRPVSAVLKKTNARLRAQLIDRLSPAEKYDLVVGDDQGTLAHSGWAVGAKLWEQNGMKHWMGICEGSAVTGVLYPEPAHGVTLSTPDGDPVHFHVIDIKGLAALLWSSYNVEIPVAGTRCKTEHPELNSGGAIIDEACFNVNPGTFHIALLNYLGLRKQFLFINRSQSMEVWNVPAIAYKVRYFNRTTGKFFASVRDAQLDLNSGFRDRFRSHRSPSAKSVIGVDTVITIGAGYTASRDGHAPSQIGDIRYRYDLELDSSGQILGGEWLRDPHPDFIWALNDSSTINQSTGDRQLVGQTWNGHEPIPGSWLEPIRASSRKNQPMKLIVEGLLKSSVE